MEKSYRSKLVGVFGYPVDENPSVVMNEAAFKAAGLDWRYITMLVRPDALKDAFSGLRALNFEGVNLTIPHKIAALAYVDEISPAAQMIGAINVIARREDKLFGDNTDGKGLVENLKQQAVALSGRRMVLLGAGGAARAIAVESALAGLESLIIINRSLEKAKAISEIVNANTSCKAEALAMEEQMPIPPCDILVNATSIGLSSNVDCPPIDYSSINAKMFVQDVITNPSDTVFLQKARASGARTGDGLGMLVQQGLIGLKLWTGLELDEKVMKRALEEEFKS